jgi:hypothetical protein
MDTSIRALALSAIAAAAIAAAGCSAGAATHPAAAPGAGQSAAPYASPYAAGYAFGRNAETSPASADASEVRSYLANGNSVIQTCTYLAFIPANEMPPASNGNGNGQGQWEYGCWAGDTGAAVGAQSPGLPPMPVAS